MHALQLKKVKRIRHDWPHPIPIYTYQYVPQAASDKGNYELSGLGAASLARLSCICSARRRRNASVFCTYTCILSCDLPVFAQEWPASFPLLFPPLQPCTHVMPRIYFTSLKIWKFVVLADATQAYPLVREASFWRVVAYYKCVSAHCGASSSDSTRAVTEFFLVFLTLINLYVQISGGNVCNCTFGYQCVNTCCVFSLSARKNTPYSPVVICDLWN